MTTNVFVSAVSDIQVDVTVPTRTHYLSLIGNIGEEVAKALYPYSGDRDALAYNLNLVLTEAMTNAIRHAGSDPLKHSVRIKIQFRRKELSIQVYDHGQGFDLDAIPCPDLHRPTEGGLVIFLIQTFMDSVDYRRVDGGNILVMRKKLS